MAFLCGRAGCLAAHWYWVRTGVHIVPGLETVFCTFLFTTKNGGFLPARADEGAGGAQGQHGPQVPRYPLWDGQRHPRPPRPRRRQRPLGAPALPRVLLTVLMPASLAQRTVAMPASLAQRTVVMPASLARRANSSDGRALPRPFGVAAALPGACPDGRSRGPARRVFCGERG